MTGYWAIGATGTAPLRATTSEERHSTSQIRRSSWTVHEWAIVSAGLAPVLLTGTYLVADNLQRASYNPMRQTISAMAGRAGTDRWIMTGGILLVAGCYLVTAAGLTGARASARGLLTVAGWPASASLHLRNPRAVRRRSTLRGPYSALSPSRCGRPSPPGARGHDRRS